MCDVIRCRNAKTFGNSSCIFLKSEAENANFLVCNGVEEAFYDPLGESHSRKNTVSVLREKYLVFTFGSC